MNPGNPRLAVRPCGPLGLSSRSVLDGLNPWTVGREDLSRGAQRTEKPDSMAARHVIA